MDRSVVRSPSVSQSSSSSLQESGSGSLSSISSSISGDITSDKSIYWKYFSKNKDNDSTIKAKATCILCNSVVSLGGIGNTADTTNLKHHMTKFHIEKLIEGSKEKNVDGTTNMSLQRELEEAYANLDCNKITDRRKALEKIIDLLNNGKVINGINESKPFSWYMLLEASQRCLRKECDKLADAAAKKGVSKGPDRNFELSKDLLVTVVKMGIKTGEDSIKTSKFVKYIDGCFKEKIMKTCKHYFLLILKDHILPNPQSLGYLEPEDFILVFTLLKSEIQHCKTENYNDNVVFNCLMLLIKYGPLSALPPSFLREQFPFISKLCQSVNRSDPRPQQEDIVEIVLHFCKHTAEDNRVSCIKLGEEVFSTMVELYFASGHDSILKVKFIEFCVIQMTIHNPNGASESEIQALASNWHNWKICIKKMYSLLTQEIAQYLRHCIKNILFFVPCGQSTVILDSFVILFVEVCKQLFKETESPMNYSLLDSFDLGTQSQKRRKVEATIESIVAEIQETKCWVWIKLVGALLKKYPALIDEKLFVNLLQILNTLQLEIKDSNTISYIYECQAILLDLEDYIKISNKTEVLNVWKIISESTLRAAGLNQNIKETQYLIQKLIDRHIINLEAVIQTYTSGVLIITEHHLHTLQLVLEHINFSQLDSKKKEELFNNLLSSQSVKDYTCFVKTDFAAILVSLMLKQCPEMKLLKEDMSPDPYQTLIEIYARSNFDIKYMITNEKRITQESVTVRTYNVDSVMVQLLSEKIKLFMESCLEEPLDKSLCIVGLLYNLLSYMINYQVIDETQVKQSYIFIMIKKILDDERLTVCLQSFETHNERRLKELLHLVSILINIFSMKNCLTDMVKDLFPLDFFRALFSLINYFQDVSKSKAELEHTVKRDITEALSKYCLVSSSNNASKCQQNIMKVLANPDYDFKNDTDYDLIMTFLKNIKWANAGFLPEEVVGKVLECLHGICSARYHSYLSALDILHVLRDVYRNIKDFPDEYKSMAVTLLQPFYLRHVYYGPLIALGILDCIEELCKMDPDCQYSRWDNKEVIKYAPEFLASDYQRVRCRSIEVLVNFIKISSGTTRLENMHRLEELFSSIYQMNLKVFEVEGELTEERKHDEVVFRASSALYTFVSIIVNCNSWIEESLFSIIKLERSKNLYSILDGDLMEKVFLTLRTKFGSPEFMDRYLENMLCKWIQMRYNINEFPYKFFNCSNKIDFYTKYFDLCLVLLLKTDRNDLFNAAKKLNLTEKQVLERCCTQIFGRALSHDINNVDENFLQKNVEVSYLSHVLGDRLKEILIEHIDQVILSLLSAVTDEKDIQSNLGETIIFTTTQLTVKQFNSCLKFIETFLCNGKPVFEFLNAGRLDKLQKILLELQIRIYNNIAEDQLKCFHQYTLLINRIANVIGDSKLSAYFIKDTIYYLVHLLKQYLKNNNLSRAILRCTKSFLRIILPDNSKQVNAVLMFTVNSIKNIALENNSYSSLCIDILQFLIIENASALATSIEKLDAFPQIPEFEEIKKVHFNIKYSTKGISLEGEIKSFLEYNDMATRQDSLNHLKSILVKEKEQLKCMYENLNKFRGFSEDSEKSILHRLVSMLVKMSCYPNDSISHEAIKCLGEIGPANLSTLVLEPEKKVLNIKCSAFELLTGHVVSLLTQYIVDSDINVVKAASDALYVILKFKEGKKVVDTGLDFGYGPINKDLIIPYIDNSQKSTSQVRVDFDMFITLINDASLWCPLESTDNTKWIKSLVLALLNSFDYGCYLKELVPISSVKTKFCEHILPLLVYQLLSLNHKQVTETLSVQINAFYSQHWNLTVTSKADKNVIPVNKKSVKCMLDVVNFVRQQFSFLNKSIGLKLNYLPISKAAEFCSAHFSALLYAELWCQEKIATIEQNNPRDGTPFENGYTLLDFIYENVSEEIGLTLQNILQSAYKAIGDLDALSGCGITFLLRPDYRVEHYKNIGRWDHVLRYYSTQPIKSSDSNHANLIDSFKMNQLYQLPLLCTSSEEPQYECLWRLGQWNTNRKDNFKLDGGDSYTYEKYQFYSLKALCDNDQYILSQSKNQLSNCIINNLKHTSLESSKNLYPILTQLQSLVEINDWEEAENTENFKETLKKWKLQDVIIRKNDFQFVEPISAQRLTILGEYIKKKPKLKKTFFDMVLNFADYAKDELQVKVSENAIVRIRQIPDLDCDIKNELQFREAQLAWLNNDKIIAQQLLRNLCKKEEITSRLKANVLKLQGEYMAEMYSDKTNILNSFYGSIKLLNDIFDQLTSVDIKMLEDIYDKIATFADREYQQIMSHIKSDLFQKKISNMKSCKEMMKSLSEQKKRTEDERKAAVIQERQSKIDENEIKTTMRDKDHVLGLALKYYMKNLSRCDANNIKIFRVISMFLENKDNPTIAQTMNELLPEIPSYKYITMLPQLIPHITDNSPDFFSNHINTIIEKCTIDHPHHTLPLLLALVNANKDREYSKTKTKISPNDRTLTAISMIKKLKSKSNLSDLITKMQTLSEALIELAYYVEDTSSNRKNEFNIPSRLKIHKIKNYDDVLVPTCTLPVSKTNTYNNITGIVKFNSTYKTVGGINAPKRIECKCTQGKSRPQLVKGQDDLRQDAVMEQVFTIMTNLLSSSKQTKNLIIRTYKIVPLSMRSGILEWVANSMPIGDYLGGNKYDEYIGAHREFRPKDKTPSDCRIKFKACSEKSPKEKLLVYNAICKEFKPVFHKFFETHFPQPSIWYERKRAYIHSVATTSMCGYILGIGDRHVSNILIDKQTAEVIHIDFGIAFEQGKCLPTPETVPFRLSRDIIDGMGVSGIEGLFRKSCEKTMEVLRANSQTILTILEVLLYDPLYFWTLSSAEANKRQTDDEIYRGISDESEEENKNLSAERALLRLRGKLQGTEDGKQTSIEQQVGTLIQQAVDPVNLCRLFVGWQPYM